MAGDEIISLHFSWHYFLTKSVELSHDANNKGFVQAFVGTFYHIR